MATYGTTGTTADALRTGQIQDEHVHETGQLIAAEKVRGTAVYNAAGDNLGTIHDLMIDKRAGRVAYAVMSFGGFLGIGEKFHPLPWNVLTYDESKGGYNVDLTPDQLRQAPSYSRDELTGFAARANDHRVDTYYGGLGYPPLI
jgi:sporulation protein YlmC with PRC-barrel domain